MHYIVLFGKFNIIILVKTSIYCAKITNLKVPLNRLGFLYKMWMVSVDENRKHPFLLPKNSHFVNVLVRNIHIKKIPCRPESSFSLCSLKFLDCRL